MKRKLLKSILCSLLVVALLAAPMSALAASKVAYILKVDVGSSKLANVHAGSALRGGNGDSTIIGTLKNGTKVLYWGEKSGQMLKIMASNGKTGYIYQGSLKTYGAMSRKQIYLAKSSTNMYKKSGSSLKKSGSISKGSPVFVYKVSGNWVLVKNMSGSSGYVKSSTLKKAF